MSTLAAGEGTPSTSGGSSDVGGATNSAGKISSPVLQSSSTTKSNTINAKEEVHLVLESCNSTGRDVPTSGKELSPVGCDSLPSSSSALLADMANRKIALVLGFNGKAYRGLQISYLDKIETIENELRKAFFELKSIKNENVELTKFDWSRSSRTDAGVSARVICLGCKIGIPVWRDRNNANPETNVVEERLDFFKAKLNEIFDRENANIRVFNVLRVPKRFDAQKAASWREYSYLLPKRVVVGGLAAGGGGRLTDGATREDAVKNHTTPTSSDNDVHTAEQLMLQGKVEEQANGNGMMMAAEQDLPQNVTTSRTKTETTKQSFSTVPETKRQFESREKTLRPLNVDRLQAALDCFLGVHSFHNFCNLKSRDVSGGGGGASLQPACGDKAAVSRPAAEDATELVEGTEETSALAGDAAGGPPSKKRKIFEGNYKNKGNNKGKKGAGKGAGKKKGKKDNNSFKEPSEGQENNTTKKETEEELELATSTSNHKAVEPAAAPPTPTLFQSPNMVDWARLVVKATNAADFDLLEEKYRKRSKDLFKHTLSTIYFFKVTEESKAEGEEFLEIRVRGQFFLYNQIRLMIGAAVAHAFGLYSSDSTSCLSSSTTSDPGLELIRNALVSPIECQFPLAPGEGLCLYQAGFSQFDERQGRMALDRKQFEKCFDCKASASPENGHASVQPNRKEEQQGPRDFLLLQNDGQIAEMDKFYREKILTSIGTEQYQEIYDTWVLTSGLHRIEISEEARHVLAKTSGRQFFAAGSTGTSTGSTTTSSTSSRSAGAATAVTGIKITKNVTNAREIGFENFSNSSNKYYQNCLPPRFTSSLLIAFPERFLPGPKLTNFQVELVRKLVDLWESGDTTQEPWKMETEDLLVFVERKMLAGS
ncbi:unnamed protein product [Amoebophrya sp. A120]|nr:unnamed protein product [Amoebophrya sp. A120]|eukprot:GSA120T00009114001.1